MERRINRNLLLKLHQAINQEELYQNGNFKVYNSGKLCKQQIIPMIVEVVGMEGHQTSIQHSRCRRKLKRMMTEQNVNTVGGNLMKRQRRDTFQYVKESTRPILSKQVESQELHPPREGPKLASEKNNTEIQIKY